MPDTVISPRVLDISILHPTIPNRELLYYDNNNNNNTAHHYI